MLNDFRLRSRKLDFLVKSTLLKKKSDLISSGKIKKNYLNNLQEASKRLLLSSIIGTSKKLINDVSFEGVLNYIEKKGLPKNITHNGMVIPRKENSLEYNIFLKSFLQFLSYTKLDKKIEYFISPPQLRIKLPKKNLLANASEYIHSDAWTNHNTSKSYTLYVPIFGDTKKNYVKFYKPKTKLFNSIWLRPKKFVEGKIIGKKYINAKVNYSIGNFIVTDCATLHQTIVNKNAGSRVSMDIAFIAKNTFDKKTIACHIKSKELEDVGYKKIIIFKDKFSDNLKKILNRKKHSLENKKILKI